jgi:hypothetical protein
MMTQTITPSPQPLPLSVVLLNRLLLTETCSHTSLIPLSNLAPGLLTVRATKITAILEGIFASTGYRHGGIND